MAEPVSVGEAVGEWADALERAQQEDAALTCPNCGYRVDEETDVFSTADGGAEARCPECAGRWDV